MSKHVSIGVTSIALQNDVYTSTVSVAIQPHVNGEVLYSFQLVAALNNQERTAMRTLLGAFAERIWRE